MSTPMTVSYANFLRSLRRETSAALYARITGGIVTATDDGARLVLAVVPDTLNWLARLAAAVRRCAQAAGYTEIVIICDPIAWRAEISLAVMERREVKAEIEA